MAHLSRCAWGTLAAADLFTTEVWTAHRLVTYDTLFIIELASRRVQIVGSTPVVSHGWIVALRASSSRSSRKSGDIGKCRV